MTTRSMWQGLDASEVAAARVLVTGAEGQLGRHVVESLSSLGVGHVIALDRRPSVGTAAESASTTVSTVEHIQGDLRDTDLLQRLAARVDRIVHLGAVLSTDSLLEPRASLDINVVSTHCLLEAAATARHASFVLGTSVAVYGDFREPGPALDERSPIRSSTLYAASKIASEAYGFAFSSISGLPFVALRFGVIYGPHQHGYGLVPSLMIDALDQAGNGMTPVIRADPRSVVAFLQVNDAAEATVRALFGVRQSAAINVVSGVGTTVEEFVTTALRLAGAGEPPVEWSPPPGHRPRYMSFRTQSISDMLGFVPSGDIEAGLATFIAWRRGLTNP